VHTDAGKYLFYSRLNIHDRGSDGYIHLHIGLGQDFCEQLVSETAVREPRSGRLVFRLRREASNEGLDLAILNLAAEYQLRTPYQQLEAERTGIQPKPETAAPSQRQRRRLPRSFWGPSGIRDL
jgi:phage terminase large subunit GpA-like protein